MSSRRFLFRLLLGWLAVLPAGGRLAAAENPAMPALGEARQLMADQSIIAVLKDTRLQLGVPCPREVTIAADKPWEGRAIEIAAIFFEGGVHRMLYSDVDPESGTEDHSLLCLAVSRDGIGWEKPSLGEVDFKGSKQNNIVGDDSGSVFSPNYVFYDPRPATAADERVKAIVLREGERRPGGQGKGLRATLWASSDGAKFRRLPIATQLQSDRINAFDGGSVFWSEAEQAFVGFFRWWDTAPPAHPRLLRDWMIDRPGVRSVFRTTSRDLITWSEPEPMEFGNTPREHIYEPCISPYFRSPGLYIALANRFNPGRRALTLEEERNLDIARLPGNKSTPVYTFASDANDIVLLVAKPGTIKFDRPFMEAFLRPGPEIGNWSSRNNYASYSGNFIATGPAEISFYVNRRHLQKANHIQRISLRTDGFVSVNASYAGGEMTTVPFTYSGDHLELNYAMSAAGEIRVEVQDASGSALPGFSLEDCDPLIGDRIDGAVSWRGRRSLAAYAAKAVRLRFEMSDADLYSFRFPGPPAR